MKKKRGIVKVVFALSVLANVSFAQEISKKPIEEKTGESYGMSNQELEKWTNLIQTYLNTDRKELFNEYASKNEEYKKINTTFEDVKKEDWFHNDVVFLNKFGVLKGKDSEKTFKPNDKVTRAEVASILTRLETASVVYVWEDDIIKDVDKDHWAYRQIAKLKSDKVMTGYEDGTFKPNNTITRAEFISMLERYYVEAMDWETMGENKEEVEFKDVKKEDWFYESLKRVKNDIGISGYEDGTFRPNEEITRAEIASFVTRYMNGVAVRVKDLPFQ